MKIENGIITYENPSEVREAVSSGYVVYVSDFEQTDLVLWNLIDVSEQSPGAGTDSFLAASNFKVKYLRGIDLIVFLKNKTYSFWRFDLQ